jgi:hypothetical protein
MLISLMLLLQVVVNAVSIEPNRCVAARPPHSVKPPLEALTNIHELG